MAGKWGKISTIHFSGAYHTDELFEFRLRGINASLSDDGDMVMVMVMTIYL